jgi:adenylate cyclase
MLSWAMGTGVAFAGLLLTALFAIFERDASVAQLSVTMISLAGLGFSVGLFATLLGARSVAAPVQAVRRGMARVTRGDLDVQVPVYDGSELGQLQSGFNEMVAGLREREQLRDLFGRHVGEEVVGEALRHGVKLGGETLEAAVVFVDLAGSTALATRCEPTEVVATLNRFFGVAVTAVREHGGWINKFAGDALLAVFGAPATLADPAGQALAAARTMAERLPAELPELDFGIGVAYGAVVAGNVGDESRYEYTVIGDPVNVAARLTSLAKHEPARVLATEPTVAGAMDRDEARQWTPGEPVVVRGRDEPVVVARPVLSDAERLRPVGSA